MGDEAENRKAMAKLRERMTEKQKAWCDYYIETLNAAEAARKAGYNC